MVYFGSFAPSGVKVHILTHSETWKNLERKAAAVLGGIRAGVTGVENPDVYHDRFEIECKYRAKLAFVPWFEQAAKHSKKSGKIPLLICKQKGKQGEYAVIKLTDLAALIDRDQDKISPDKC